MPNWIQCQQQKSNLKEEEIKTISVAFITQNNIAEERLFLNISSTRNSSQSMLRIISKGIEKKKYNYIIVTNNELIGSILQSPMINHSIRKKET